MYPRPMSRRRSRKSKLYMSIEELNGVVLGDVPPEKIVMMRGLMSCGFIRYDPDYRGLRIVATDVGRKVLENE